MSVLHSPPQFSNGVVRLPSDSLAIDLGFLQFGTCILAYSSHIVHLPTASPLSWLVYTMVSVRFRTFPVQLTSVHYHWHSIYLALLSCPYTNIYQCIFVPTCTGFTNQTLLSRCHIGASKLTKRTTTEPKYVLLNPSFWALWHF